MPPGPEPPAASVADAAVDLLLGSRCVGCERPGRLLCRDCAAALPREAAPAWPTPAPTGLVTPWATASYDGCVRAMVLGHKEHRLLALRDPLALLLARAVAAAVADGDRSSWCPCRPVPPACGLGATTRPGR